MRRQRRTETPQVAQVGMKLFRELDRRARKTEAEVQEYREALVALAESKGVSVPDFGGEEGGEGGEMERGQLREWLAQVLSEPSKEQEGKPKSRGRGGPSRSRGGSRGRGGRVGKGLRSQDAEDV